VRATTRALAPIVIDAVHLELVRLEKVLVAHLLVADVARDSVGHLGGEVRVHDAKDGGRRDSRGCGSRSGGRGRLLRAAAEHVDVGQLPEKISGLSGGVVGVEGAWRGRSGERR